MTTSEDIAHLKAKSLAHEQRQDSFDRRLRFLSTRVGKMSERVEDMTKKDEIAEAVAEKIGSHNSQLWSKRQKLIASSVGFVTIALMLTQIMLLLTEGR